MPNVFRYWPALAIAALSTFLVLLAQGTYIPSGAFNSATPMTVARDGASSAVLLDGRILVTGGKDDSGNPLDSAEILGGSSASQMHAPRAGHISVTLHDGTVLVAGGSTTGGAATNSTEVYNPSAGDWTVAAHSMLEARMGATATLLSDGRVLIAGGDNGSGPLQTTEIYDPATGVFSAGAPLSSARKNHAAALLNDGRVAIAGGMGVGSDGQTPLPLNTIDIYDSVAGTATPFPATMSAPRIGLSATTLLKGQVLLAGGGAASGAASATTDILDVTAGTVAPGPGMSAARSGHLALLLPNNNTVLMVSGTSDSAGAEIYAPWQNAFTPFGTLAATRTDVTGGASAQTGAAFIVGGQASGTASSVVETIHFPMVKTDKPDYHPGETAQITGSGFVPGEVVNLSIEEIPDLDADSPIQFQETADALGHISTTLPIDEADANIRFYLSATGATSGLTAGMTFTDAVNIATATITVKSAACSANQTTFTIGDTVCASSAVTVGGSGAAADYFLQWYAGTNTTSVSPVQEVHETGITVDSTQTATFNTTGQVITGTWTVVACKHTGSCNGTGNNLNTALATFTLNAAPTKATPSFSGLSSPTITYGTASTTLSMTVVGSGTNVPTGTFTIALNGGAPQTATFVSSTANSATYSSVFSTGSLTVATSPYTIAYHYGGDANYNAISPDGSGTLTVSPKPATWTTNANSKTYGDPEPGPVTTGSGSGFLAADGVTATYSRAAGETVLGGPYHITATLSATGSLSNYTITNAGADFTINTKAATWTTNANSKTYGDADPVPLTTGSGSGFLAADGVTATYSRAAGETVAGSPYHITATLSPAGVLSNYTITNTGASFTINQKSVTPSITANDKMYDGNDTATLATCTVAVKVGSDDVACTSSTVTFASANASASAQVVTATGITLTGTTSGNYSLSTTTAATNAKINPKPATWTTNANSKTYGDPDPSPLTTGSGSGFLAADGVTATYSRAAGETVLGGPYHITATLDATGLLTNYTITNAGANFTINTKAATWTTNANSKAYGDPDPSPLTTGSGSGFVAADGVTATYSRVAGETVAGSPYHITATLSPAGVLSNYTITNTGASFTINQKSVTPSITANDKMYDGNNTATLATCTVAVKVGSDDVACTSSTVTFASANASASTQLVTATGITLTGTTSGNYLLSATTATTYAKINPKPATWNTNANSKTYGDPDPSPVTTGSGSGFLVADGVTATYSRVAGETVLGGSYHITATLSATGLLTNYTITNAGAEFTINPKPATWTTNATSKTYGDPDPVPLTTGSGSGFQLADGVTATYSRAAGETVAGSPYHITATLSPAGVLSNYTITNTGASFTINQKPVTPSITANDKTYDGGNAATLATCTVAVKVGGDDVACTSATVTFASSNASASAQLVTAVGITLTGGTAGNYSLSTPTATTYAKINPNLATWTTNANSKTFGSSDPVPLTTGGGIGFLVADGVTATYSRAAGETVLGGPYHITATLSATGLLTNYTITNLGANFTITPLTVVTMVAVTPTPQQYSDLVTFNAKVSPIAVGGFAATTGADFYVGTQKVGSCTLDNLTGICTTALSAALLEPTPFGTLPTGQMAPGNHQITAKFTGLNPNFTVPDATTYDGTNSTILAITQEDARADYTGQTFVATVNNSVNVPLTFTIRDSNALLPSDPDYATYYDANPGDIRNALVTIKVDNVILCANQTPVLVNSDSRTGTVGCIANLAIGGPYNVTIDVTNYYHASALSDTSVPITVSLASGTGFITGGGYTINGTSPNPVSLGTYKGDAGRKTNYGFNVQYNKKGTNLQGNANIIIRGGGHSYQIKANSMQSLVVNNTTAGGTATFVSKANLAEVTNPDNPIALGGNYSLTLSLVDNGQPGTSDTIGIQLFNGSTLLFSNNWNGVQTVNKLIDGGNLMVH